MRLIICFLISINILIASETNTVKTSELELFLFKVGFESLLKDVDITKNKSNLNEKELLKLNSKIEIIMNELYKQKRVFVDDNNPNDKNTIIKIRDENLKEEISNLKKEVNFLKEQITKLLIKKEIKEQVLDNKQYQIIVSRANIRSKPSSNSEIVAVLNKGTFIDISSCNNYGWCKFKDEEKYIAIFLMKK